VNIMTKRKKRHSPEQIVRKIQQADRILAEGGDVAAVLREFNITEATYYRWRNHYGGLKAEDAKKLNPLPVRIIPPPGMGTLLCRSCPVTDPPGQTS
jgi:transposase-like protein